MSKSLGNGVDPLDVIDQYGCDTCILFNNQFNPGQDLRFISEKVKASTEFYQ